MRHLALSLVTLAAFAVTGCGAATVPGAAQQRAAAVKAASLVEEGTIVFDKELLYKAVDVLGVGPAYEKALASVGIKTVRDLLLAGTTPTARKHLAQDTGISPKLLLTWINQADLMRVTGCGPEYARLLERAGVDTVLDLGRRNSISLAAKLKEANDLGGGKKAVKRVPDVVTTTKWVDNATTFVRMVTY
jgi:predicted flap endonuclease-1-like 5' DNA nuclease